MRHRVTGSNTYRAWVAYWRRGLAEPAVLVPQLAGAQPGDPAAIEFLLGLDGDEFSLIRGGEIVFDGDERSLEATLRDLYERLVRAPEPDEAHHVAFIFEHATDTNREGELEHDAKVVLYDGTDLVENTRGLLGLITPFAQTIDVSAPESAADPLRHALALA